MQALALVLQLALVALFFLGLWDGQTPYMLCLSLLRHFSPRLTSGMGLSDRTGHIPSVCVCIQQCTTRRLFQNDWTSFQEKLQAAFLRPLIGRTFGVSQRKYAIDSSSSSSMKN